MISEGSAELVPFPEPGGNLRRVERGGPRPGAATGSPPPRPRVPVDPPGLSDALTRYADVARAARERQASHRADAERLAGHVTAQVAAFAETMSALGQSPSVRTRLSRRESKRFVKAGPACWTVRYWRLGAFTDARASYHLYIAADGTLLESVDDPGVARALNQLPHVVPVDLTARLVELGPVDSRVAVNRVVEELAALLQQAGADL